MSRLLLLICAIYCLELTTVTYGVTLDVAGGMRAIWHTIEIDYQRNTAVVVHFLVAPVIVCLIALGSLAFARRADTVRAATMLCWLGAAISAAITIWWFMIQNGPSPLAISVVFFVVAATSMGKL